MKAFNLVIAEDDVAMRRWLETVLVRLGAKVEVVSSGWELLSLLANENPIDLVISDVRMPAPGGLQALAMARTAGLDTPFLLITAFGDDGLRHAARRLCADVLDKPFLAADLEARIHQAVASHAGPW